MNFWEKLSKPFFVLAPLADVTDPAFRRLIAKYGKPDAMYTEFVSADGLFLGGRDALIKDLVFSESERPIIAQFFTSKPDMMEKAAALAKELGFDGIDINMGCPDASVNKQGAGAGLIQTPELAVELIQAAKRGGGGLPVSVKTRIGFNKNEIETWIPKLLSAEPAALALHARTRKEMSLVPARWEHVKRAVEIRNDMNSNTLIIGNGDVTDIEHAKKLTAETGADGVMLGRAIFGNPWLFNKTIQRDAVPIPDRLNVLVEHTKLFEELCSQKSFAIMRKHFKAYVNGWDGAKELRVELMECQSAGEVEMVIHEYLKGR